MKRVAALNVEAHDGSSPILDPPGDPLEINRLIAHQLVVGRPENQRGRVVENRRRGLKASLFGRPQGRQNLVKRRYP